MQRLITILLLITYSLCYGQGKYSVRKTYQYEGNDSNKKHLIETNKFNRQGKIQDEDKADEDGYVEKIKHYYNHDTILSKTVHTHKSFTKKAIEWYYYDKNGRLFEKRVNKYEVQIKSCIPINEPPQWGDTAITHYSYDNAGNVIEEITRVKENKHVPVVIGGLGSELQTNRVINKYDNNNQLLSTVRQHIFSLNDRQIELARQEKWNDTITIDTVEKMYPAIEQTIIHYHNPYYIDTIYVNYTFDTLNRVLTETEVKDYIHTKKTKYYAYLPEKRLIKWVKTYFDRTINKTTITTRLYTYE